MTSVNSSIFAGLMSTMLKEVSLLEKVGGWGVGGGGLRVEESRTKGLGLKSTEVSVLERVQGLGFRV